MSVSVRHALRLVAIERWLPALLLGAWWFFSRNSKSFFFPPLSQIFTRFREDWFFARVGSDVVPSLTNLFSALAIASFVGIAVGVILGLMPTAESILRPVSAFFRALPGAALLPLAVIVIGLGSRMCIPLIAFVTVWPILLNTTDGVKGIEPMVHDVRRSFRINPLLALWKIILPAASPQIVVGLRQALSRGLVLLIFSELVGTTSGIGYFTQNAQRNLDVADMWSGTLLLAILGYFFNLVFRLFEQRVLGWHHLRLQVINGGKS